MCAVAGWRLCRFTVGGRGDRVVPFVPFVPFARCGACRPTWFGRWLRRGFLKPWVTSPSRLVGVEPRVDEPRGRGGFGAGSAVGRRCVNAPPDPDGSARFCLVAHGVGQHLGGVDAVDHVAVLVEASVEVRQSEVAVPVEDAQSGRSKGPPGDGAGIRLDRWQRWTADRRRSTTLVVGNDGPQAVTNGIGLGQVAHPISSQTIDGRFDAPDRMQEAISLDLEFDPLGQGDPGPAAVQPQASAGDTEARLTCRPTLSARRRSGRRVVVCGVEPSWVRGRKGMVTAAHGCLPLRRSLQRGPLGVGAAADLRRSRIGARHQYRRDP